jgi:exosome complex component RRP41
MKDFVCACAAGYIDGTPLLDLNYIEDSAGGPDLPVAILPQSDKIAMLQMDSKIPIEVFEKVTKLAISGCHTIYQVLTTAVEEYSKGLLESRGTPVRNVIE